MNAIFLLSNFDGSQAHAFYSQGELSESAFLSVIASKADSTVSSIWMFAEELRQAMKSGYSLFVCEFAHAIEA